MDQRTEIRAFLASRRARLTPEQAGLPTYGGNRRVPGLRREEVALLAGVSVDHYTQMERDNLGGVSDSVLHALAGALRLDEAERAHLFNLARTANALSRPRRPSGPQRVRPSIQRLLDAMTGVPAYVRTGRLDILGLNRLGAALYAPVLTGRRLPVNLARFLFLDPTASDYYVDWDKTANDAVAILRHLHRRAGLRLPGGAGLPGQLGGHPGPARPGGDGPGPRRGLTRSLSRQVQQLRSEMELQPKQPSVKGPAERFTGDVWYDVIASGEPPSRLRVNVVRFAPGACNAWHAHALGQTLHVTEGVGLIQARGGQVLQIRAGDTIHTPPGEWHWHGAAPDHFMSHLAIWEAPESGPESQWGDPVTDAEYHDR
jgi:quercetin dioxygenase-like cupin family protein/transcriptional regulator with XRE-family HTH domain